MVVFGNWEKPPLWILRNKLIENRITREETISGNTNIQTRVIRTIYVLRGWPRRGLSEEGFQIDAFIL